MAKLSTLPIIFIKMDDLIKRYKDNIPINFENLGVITDQRNILAQVLYTKNRIYKNPYKLTVDLNTYQLKRKIIIKYIIEDIIIAHIQKGSTYVTITIAIRYLIHFVNWMNQENILYINNLDHAVSIFYEYTLFLKRGIRTSKILQAEAHVKHTSAYKFLSTIFNDKENRLLSSVKLIKNIRNNTLSKSSDEDMKYHYNFYYNFFHQVTDFLLSNNPYPLKLKLSNKEIWCLPSAKIFFKENKDFPMAFDPKNGTVRSVVSLQDIYHFDNDNIAKVSIKSFRQTMDNANKSQSSKRVELASHALKAFYILFLTNTGMNDSTAATLAWVDEYETDDIQYKFKNIKYRAGNKLVEFQIKNQFVNDFKKYLQLRDYLLNGHSLEYLFFIGNGKKARITNTLKHGVFSSYINKLFITSLDSSLPNISSKQLRVNKTHQVVKQNGILAASQLLQSSVTTIMKSYLGESDESSAEQLSNYFDKLNENIFSTSDDNVSTNIGKCSNHEISTLQNQKSENCLFCEHFRIYVDKEDLQKLYSLKYLISECRYIAKNEQHFNSVYGDIYKRIESIEKLIITSNKSDLETLKEIESDVFEHENLHPYWEHKLNMLISIGML